MRSLVLNRNSYINPYIEYNPCFGSKKAVSTISKAKRKEIIQFVDNFRADIQVPNDIFTKVRNKAGRILHPSFGIACFAKLAPALLDGKLESATTLLCVGLLNCEIEKVFHNIAIRKARILSKKLIKENFSEEERILAVKKYLNKDGAFIYSKVFNITSPENVKKLANGQKVQHIKGLFPSFFHQAK